MNTTDKPTFQVATISDVQYLTGNGPWASKSGGSLNALFNLPLRQAYDQYFHYEPSELEKIRVDMRGLRSYHVRDIPNGAVGAKEWHRIRNELVFALHGTALWTCEDVYGNSKVFVLDEGHGVWNPPFVFHTYKAQ